MYKLLFAIGMVSFSYLKFSPQPQIGIEILYKTVIWCTKTYYPNNVRLLTIDTLQLKGYQGFNDGGQLHQLNFQIDKDSLTIDIPCCYDTAFLKDDVFGDSSLHIAFNVYEKNGVWIYDEKRNIISIYIDSSKLEYYFHPIDSETIDLIRVKD
jgi:hypothetical protein